MGKKFRSLCLLIQKKTTKKNTKAHCDFLLTSNNVKGFIHSIGLDAPAFLSDHRHSTFTISKNKIENETGYWRFNNAILDDQIAQLPSDISPPLRMDTLLCKLRAYTIIYTSEWEQVVNHNMPIFFKWTLNSLENFEDSLVSQIVNTILHLSDSICISRTLSISLQLYLYLLDSICISQTLSVSPILDLYFSDSLCISWTLSVSLGHYLYLFDSICISQTLFVCLWPYLYLSDSICISQTLSVSLGLYLYL